MKKVIALSVISTLVCGGATLAYAVDCVDRICVHVQSDPTSGQIVITAEQNRPGSTATPRASRSPRPKSTVKKSPRPIPTSAKPRPKSTYKPRPKVSASAISLSDRITQLLPQRGLFYAPHKNPLVGIPVYVWSDAGPTFALATSILGINVGVTLTPTFIWDFGDGTSLQTTLPGAAYPAPPHRQISHIYKKAGRYPITLTVSWSGTWSAQGVTSDISGGAIVQKMFSTIAIAPAPTRFTK